MIEGLCHGEEERFPVSLRQNPSRGVSSCDSATACTRVLSGDLPRLSLTYSARSELRVGDRGWVDFYTVYIQILALIAHSICIAVRLYPVRAPVPSKSVRSIFPPHCSLPSLSSLRTTSASTLLSHTTTHRSIRSLALPPFQPTSSLTSIAS